MLNKYENEALFIFMEFLTLICQGADLVVLCRLVSRQTGFNITVDPYWNSGKTIPRLLDPVFTSHRYRKKI
jgi:hypothetical protein